MPAAHSQALSTQQLRALARLRGESSYANTRLPLVVALGTYLGTVTLFALNLLGAI